MTSEELQIIIDSIEWRFLSKGTYNQVFISQKEITIGGFTGKWVLKQPVSGKALNKSDRAVRKWNSLNPDYPAFKVKTGWIAPYLGNTLATDQQISEELVHIYLKRREIVGDAAAREGVNFLLHNGKVVCIDVDHAFRRNSSASLAFDAADYAEDCKQFLNICSMTHPLTVTVIRTLFYLEKQLSESEIKDEYITVNLIKRLRIFRHEKKRLTPEIMDTLLNIAAVDPTGEIKDKYLTPSFVETVLAIRKHQTIATSELLASLINNQLLGQGKPVDILKGGDLDDVKIIIKYNPALLNQLDERGRTLLHLAAMFGHAEIVDYLLEKGLSIDAITPIDPNSTNSQKTALDLAIVYSRDAVANLLLDKGAIISPALYGKFKYLCFLIRNGSLEAVKSFIDRNPQAIHATDNFHQTALLWATERGQKELVEWLIAQGADVNTATQLPPDHALYSSEHNQSPLDWAIRKGHITIIAILIHAGAIANRVHITMNGKTLKELIESGDIDSVKILVTHNKALLNQVNEVGHTPLHYAALYGQVDIARYLIDSGADLNAVTPVAEGIRYPDKTALDILLYLQTSDAIVLLLIEAGARVPPALNNHSHAIHVAARNGRLDLVKTLIQQDPALIHVRDTKNQTPLLWAASRGHTDIVTFLIELGADINLATRDPNASCSNYSPLDWAIQGMHIDTVAVLNAAGAIANVTTKVLQSELIAKPLVQFSIFPSAEEGTIRKNELCAAASSSSFEPNQTVINPSSPTLLP